MNQARASEPAKYAGCSSAAGAWCSAINVLHRHSDAWVTPGMWTQRSKTTGRTRRFEYDFVPLNLLTGLMNVG
jgi:hypothetical protein